MNQPLGQVATFVAGIALWFVAFAVFGKIAHTIAFALSLLTIPSVYRWHRREIRAGRREPVWFGKHRHQTPS